MRYKYLITALVFTVIVFCNSCEEIVDTGLEGIVYMGPINPVATEGVPNDLPFEANFNLYDSEDNFIRSFTSNENGEYRVLLSPGDYIIVPSESAPLINPLQQVKNITVDENAITSMDLYFDTGIR